MRLQKANRQPPVKLKSYQIYLVSLAGILCYSWLSKQDASRPNKQRIRNRREQKIP